MKEILDILPLEYRDNLEKLAENKKIEEIRLRCGRRLSYVENMEERPLSTGLITAEQLDLILARSCDFSLHSVQEQLSRGFLTLAGGHRVGLCGTVVKEEGKITHIKEISSISIRIAGENLGIGEEILPFLMDEQNFSNTLILAPPGEGKTTLLRDVIRCISDGRGISPLRVGVVDQRSELASLLHGTPRFDLGERTDILDACDKREGMMMLLRSMNPQVLAVDEITESEDVEALRQAIGCGVKLLATAHGKDVSDLKRRPVYRKIQEELIFQKVVTIYRKNERRACKVEDLV